MTARDVVNHILITNKRLKGFEDISDFGVEVLAEMMKKYAKEKCLEAIRNTRHKCCDILTQEAHQIDPDNLHFLLRDIQNIPNQDVMPEL